MKKKSVTIKLVLANLLLLSTNGIALGQRVDFKNLSHLPDNIRENKSKLKTYTMITEYFDYDLQANFLRKSRIKGDLTYFSANDSIRWSNVTISQIADLEAPFCAGQKEHAFENFKYLQSDDVLKEEAFSKIPQVDIRLKNLVWDMLAFEVFAYECWDSLELNRAFTNHSLNGRVKMGNDGAFENKEMMLSWIGVTKLNNELCAVIKFSQMNGKVNIELDNLAINGRSHYWGEVYVSLKDKDIEYATLSEDVVTDVQFKGKKSNALGYTVRQIELVKQLK